MSLLKCTKCGEMFSDSYKECPFCQEDEEFFGGRKASRGGRRVQKPKAPSIIGPAMVLVVLLLAGFLMYTFLGTDIAKWFDKDDEQPVIDQPIDDEQQNGETQQGEDETQPDPVPVTITMDKANLSLEAGKSGQLTASGAENITWASSDETVATVDAAGKVTAVKVGTATITAGAEEATSAACVITVTASKKNLTLQSIYGTKNDISISVGGTAPMEVIGTDSKVEWSMEDSSIAKVDSDGYVKGLKSGKTKVIAKVDGQTLTCIVRVG